jgi:inosine-uridine nucleoside N-ribohydrolase
VRGVRARRVAAAFALLVLALGGACRREAAAPADTRTAVWLDISPAFGDPPRDPGDALAFLQAYGSGRLHVRGLSVTFGNVPLVRGYPTAQELMNRVDTGLLRPWRGPSSPEERAAPTEASELLEEELRKQPLTVIAVGPATTVAAVLVQQPDIADRIERVVLVAGQPAAEPDRQRAVDANVTADPGSVQILLDSPAPITLVPADLGPKAGLDAADLDRLDQGRGPIKLITPSARGWLGAEAARTGSTAFPIPGLLAVDVVAHPGEIRCEAAIATLTNLGAAPPALLVSSVPGAPGRRVTWCHTADPGAKQRILADVLRLQPLRR